MTTNPSELNPGSYEDFKKLTGEHDALGRYSVALWEYKVALAEEKGITVDELHEGPFDYSEQDVA